MIFVPAAMMKHLSALKDICHSFSQDSSAFRSFCKSCPSEILLISLYRRQSSANNFTLLLHFQASHLCRGEKVTAEGLFLEAGMILRCPKELVVKK